MQEKPLVTKHISEKSIEEKKDVVEEHPLPVIDPPKEETKLYQVPDEIKEEEEKDEIFNLKGIKPLDTIIKWETPNFVQALNETEGLFGTSTFSQPPGLYRPMGS